jgi:hypothetical protein
MRVENICFVKVNLEVGEKESFEIIYHYTIQELIIVSEPPALP